MEESIVKRKSLISLLLVAVMTALCVLGLVLNAAAEDKGRHSQTCKAIDADIQPLLCRGSQKHCGGRHAVVAAIGGCGHQGRGAS